MLRSWKSIGKLRGDGKFVSNNQGPGVWLSSGSLFGTIGLTTISNNSNPSSNTPPPGAYGIVVLGAGKAQIGTCFGPNTIQGNQSGGIYTQENAELSLYNCGLPYQSYILDNGPVGISAGLGSQVTLYQDVQISGHTGSGVELYGNSQLNVNGSNLISENGTAGNLRSAGIVVDGNSEAYLCGGRISFNHGPGIMALLNSSADFTGATFSGNSGGVISCDSSAYMVSDLASGAGNPSAGIACATPHNRGNHHGIFVAPAIQDTSVVKARHARYKKIASGKFH
jgi:Right handed beta helix region